MSLSLLVGTTVTTLGSSINPYLATFLGPENVVCFLYLMHNIQEYFRLDFFMEAKNMNPHLD